MKHIVAFGGAKKTGGDVKNKSLILEWLSSNYDYKCTILSRVGYADKHLTGKNVTFEYMYDFPEFKKKLTRKQIAELEHWLQYPLPLIQRHDKNAQFVKNKRKIQKIRQITAQQILFWKNYFQSKKPDIFLHSLPSYIPGIVPVLVARRLNIRCVIILGARFENSAYFVDENFEVIYWNKKKGTKELFQKLQKQYDKRDRPISAMNYFDPMRSTLSDFRHKMRDLYANLTMKGVPKEEHILRPDVKETFKRIILHFVRRKMQRLYCQPSRKEPFFLFPLHWEDDAQITTREFFANQVYLIRAIAKCLPRGHKLYAKLHPGHLGTVPLKQLRALSKIKNVRVINERNIIKLIKQSKLVLTINSTTGLESIILGKPVITFGTEFYSLPKVTYPLKDLTRLPQTIFKALHSSGDQKARQELVTRFYNNSLFFKTPIEVFFSPLKPSEVELLGKTLHTVMRTVL